MAALRCNSCARSTARAALRLIPAAAAFDTDGNNDVLSGNIGGVGGLTKIGAGILTLSGANLYSGGTTIDTGTLALSGLGTLGATSKTTTINTGATLDLGGTTQTQAAVNLAGGTLQNGALNAVINATGGIIDNIGGTASITATAGTTLIEGTDSYSGATNISGGTLDVLGTITGTSSVTIGAGGTLSGIGTVDPPTVTIVSGATFAPGTPGMPGTSMTIVGNLAFQSGALYVVYLNPTTSTFATVTGTASLAGTVQANFGPGTYLTRTYDLLHASGLSGTFSSLTTTNVPPGLFKLDYTSTDVFLDFTASIGNGTPLTGNKQNTASTINAFIDNGGALPASFLPLFTLSGAGLQNTLSQIDGEDGTSAQRGAFDLMNEFLGLMLDPFVDGRWNPSTGAGALGFAPDQQTNLPPDIALAYAGLLKTPAASSPGGRPRRGSISAGARGPRASAAAPPRMAIRQPDQTT